MEQGTAQQSTLLAGDVSGEEKKKTRAEQTRIRDRELKAMERIVRELNALDDDPGNDDGAAHVVRYIAERYGLIIVRGDD